jgi:hypothetical protein
MNKPFPGQAVYKGIDILSVRDPRDVELGLNGAVDLSDRRPMHQNVDNKLLDTKEVIDMPSVRLD